MATDLNGILTKIDQNATHEQVEKLRLLAAAVTDYGEVSRVNGTPEIFRAVELEYKEVPNTVAVFKRLLLGAGYPRRYIEMLSEFTSPSQPTPEMDKLYFYELLVKVANQIGNGEYFRYLRNRIPRNLLEINREGIPSCVHLFQKLEMGRVLDPSKAAVSLAQLEQWLKDINRNDVAEVVRKRIDEIRENEPPVQEAKGIIQPQANERLVKPVQETV